MFSYGGTGSENLSTEGRGKGEQAVFIPSVRSALDALEEMNKVSS